MNLLRDVLVFPCLETQKRLENIVDTKRLFEKHHKQLLRAGYFCNQYHKKKSEE